MLVFRKILRTYLMDGSLGDIIIYTPKDLLINRKQSTFSKIVHLLKALSL